MAQSPMSSPRLPSPPPMAEDQIGPTSPGFHNLDDLSVGAGTMSPGAGSEASISQRIRPGTRSADMHISSPPVPPSDIDSAFQLTEYLSTLYNHLTNPDAHTTAPITRVTAVKLATPPPSIEQDIYLYELCRLLVARTNQVVTALFSESPACSASTCPEMRASEWQYLCAAHEAPKGCCAIDYCCHTLDWAATQLTSSKLFPSRLALGTTEAVPTAVQMRRIGEIFRRVYRIFAHAWFQHRDVFWRVEGRTGLYILFKTVCDEYRLMGEDSYTVPAEAEGASAKDDSDEEDVPQQAQQADIRIAGLDETTQRQLEGRDTQKRATPGRAVLERQNSVSTVIHEALEEEDEPEDDDGAQMRGVPREIEPGLEEDDKANAPVVAEHPPPAYQAQTNPTLASTSDKEHAAEPQSSSKTSTAAEGASPVATKPNNTTMSSVEKGKATTSTDAKTSPGKAASGDEASVESVTSSSIETEKLSPGEKSAGPSEDTEILATKPTSSADTPTSVQDPTTSAAADADEAEKTVAD